MNNLKLNKIHRILLSAICLIISVSVVAIAMAGCIKISETVTTQEDYDVQYVLYLGTNDKDTVQPVFEPQVAKEKAIEILLKHFGGYTIQEANGGWIDGDKIYTEYTLVIYLSDTTLEEVHAACDEFITVFNQTSILVQANQTKTEFYGGNKG